MKESANQKCQWGRQKPKTRSPSSRSWTAWHESKLRKDTLLHSNSTEKARSVPTAASRLNEDRMAHPPQDGRRRPPSTSCTVSGNHIQQGLQLCSQQGVRSSALGHQRVPGRRRGYTIMLTQQCHPEIRGASWGRDLSCLLTAMKNPLLLMRWWQKASENGGLNKIQSFVT